MEQRCRGWAEFRRGCATGPEVATPGRGSWTVRGHRQVPGRAGEYPRAGRRLRHAGGEHSMLQVQVLMAARSGDQDHASDPADVAAGVSRRHRAGAAFLVGSSADWGRRVAGKAGIPMRLEAGTGLRDACVRLSVPGSQSGSASNRHMAHRMPYQRAAVRPWVARNGRH